MCEHVWKIFIDHLNKTSSQVTSTLEQTGNLTSKIAAILCKDLALYYTVANIML